MTESINITPTKRARKRGFIAKPTGRKPMRVGALLLKEVPYKAEWRIQATWRDPHRRKQWFNNWRHAEEFAQRENKRLDELKEKGAGRYTFNDAADSFLKRREQLVRAKDRSFSPDTLRHYRIVVDVYLKPKFGDRRLESITSREVDDWVIEQSEKFAFHTVSGRFMVFKMILDHAVERDMLRANPLVARKVNVPGKPTKRADIPDRSDLEALRKYLTEPRPLKNSRSKWSGLRVLVLLGASCGMRAGEVSGLRWDSIDPDTGEIEIKESIARVAGRKGPKTESGYRKVPITPRAREIINEHAVIYKQLYGKCVGSVLRSRDMDYLSPGMVSSWFNEVMNECGLVKPDAKLSTNGRRLPKFSYHALRHWCASHWMKATGGDVHQVAKWLGHKNASMTLDVYGHCLDDPEAREKFLEMPDWLNPAVEIDAPSSVRPIQIREPLALPAPEGCFESDVEMKGQEIEPPTCPIHVPEIAKPWVEPFIMMLVNGMSIPDAYREIVPQLEPGKRRRLSGQAYVLAEFERVKLPTPKVIVARLRDEKILALHGQKYQSFDIARMVGCGYSVVHRALQSRHKENANNPLNRKIKLNPHLARKTQPKHNLQLKLL
jgi:integrase